MLRRARLIRPRRLELLPFEDTEAAVKSGELLMELWSGHPKQQFVGAFS
jgi:hypothetical protein